MIIKYEKNFKKQYKKLPEKIKTQFSTRLKLFLKDQKVPQLKVHPLKGKFAGYWSMSVSGDIRAIYKVQNKEIIIFALIGTHSKLYG